MSKVVEKNVAEIIVIAIFTIIVMMSSCGVAQNNCAAYASIECENCDEID
tara:strand:- start:338 stop:487 length:150 start_codon:yes stop_codon:yes gene_type:complete